MADRARASRYRELVDIQVPNVVDNGRGGRRPPAGQAAWKTIATGIYCEIVPLRGGEALVHAIQRNLQLYRVEMRPRPGITTAMRLWWKGMALDIKAAPPPGRDALVLTCESGMPG